MTSAMLRLAENEQALGVPRKSLADTADDLATGFRELAERAVLPRLCRALAAGRAPVPRPAAPSFPAPSFPAPSFSAPSFPAVPSFDAPAQAEAVDLLADGLLAGDVDGVCERIVAIRAGGRPLDRIYLDLLMPAALQLDGLLAQDARTCAEVSVAFLNLQVVLRRLAPDFYGEAEGPSAGSRALLATPPAPSDKAGLQLFGLLLTAEFFRRDGWDAWTERNLGSAEFRGALEGQWFDVAGVFASRDADLDAVASGVRLIRRESLNKSVGIIACGSLFKKRPELCRLIGADRWAPDLLASLTLAKTCIPSHIPPCIPRPSERLLLS